MSLELVHTAGSYVREWIEVPHPFLYGPDGETPLPTLQIAGASSDLCSTYNSNGTMIYLDAFGIILPDSGSNLWAMRLDGTLIKMTTAGYHGIVGWDVLTELPLVMPSNQSKWRASKIPACTRERGGGYCDAHVLVPDETTGTTHRGLKGSGDAIYWGAIDGTLNTLCGANLEYRVTGSFNDGNGHTFMAPANEDNSVWFGNADDGSIMRYDYVAKTEANTYRRWIEPGWHRATYVRKHDLFVALYGGTVDGGYRKSPFTLRVYANENVAYALSSPVFAHAPRRGGLVDVSATLTSDHGEPCANRLIRFEVTEGTVTPAVVLTDENGVATAEYRAPNDTPTGASVTATLDE